MGGCEDCDVSEVVALGLKYSTAKSVRTRQVPLWKGCEQD